jgi:hypothetical protein
MLPSKPPKLFAVLFAILALSAFYFFPSNPPPKIPADVLAVEQPEALPVIPAQTGRGEALEAIVPLNQAALRTTANSRLSQQEPSLIPQSTGIQDGFSAFQKFIAEVTDGEAEVVRGVYAPGVLALPVVQQPPTNSAYVSEEQGTVTQFRSAAQYSVTGLLAHNYLSGERFYDLEIGQEVVIVMGNGATNHYEVTGTYQFKKLTPDSLRSNLVELSTGKTLTTAQVFERFYRGAHKVTFQTCLEGEGSLNWGLVFIVAKPVGGRQ